MASFLRDTLTTDGLPMIKIQINDRIFDSSEANPSFLTKAIHDLQRRGMPICLKVCIKFDDVDIVLQCGECPAGQGGGRHPNEREQEIFDIWEKHGCKGKTVNAGHIVAFLKRIS